MMFAFVRIKTIDSPEAAEDPEQVIRCICGEGNPWSSNLCNILSVMDPGIRFRGGTEEVGLSIPSAVSSTH